MRIMEPGESYDIEIAIPSDHVPGTNWYHPHAHGSADVQIASGALGALIIEGDFADVPEIVAAKERLLVLTEAVFDAFGTVEDFGTLFPETAAHFLAVNGIREPTITMRPGEVQRWRILHAGWQDDLFLDLEGHAFNPIARDGIPLARMGLSVPRKPEQPTDYPNAMLMAPGQRHDVLVQAGEPGTYLLRAVPYDQGYAAPTGPIARLVVAGDPLPMNLPARLPAPLEKLIGDEEITGTRVIKFCERASKGRRSFGGLSGSRSMARRSIPPGSINAFAWALWRNGRSSTTTTRRSRVPHPRQRHAADQGQWRSAG